MRITWNTAATLKTPRSKENGTIVASVIMKTPKTGKVSNMVLKLTPTQRTTGIIFPKMKPIALMSAVIIFLPGGFENMNFLTTQLLKMLRVAQTTQIVMINISPSSSNIFHSGFESDIGYVLRSEIPQFNYVSTTKT